MQSLPPLLERLLMLSALHTYGRWLAHACAKFVAHLLSPPRNPMKFLLRYVLFASIGCLALPAMSPDSMKNPEWTTASPDLSFRFQTGYRGKIMFILNPFYLAFTQPDDEPREPVICFVR